MPHPCLSLSHAAGTVVAVGMRGGRGLGVDLEPSGRSVSPAVIRRIDTSTPPGAQVSEDPDERLRLWVIKEALFKAEPANAGLTLRQIEPEERWAGRGGARSPYGRYRYAITTGDHGVLALAWKI